MSQLLHSFCLLRLQVVGKVIKSVYYVDSSNPELHVMDIACLEHSFTISLDTNLPLCDFQMQLIVLCEAHKSPNFTLTATIGH